MATYARPELLAETGWLAEHLGDANVRVVDCDEPPAYQRLHIDGAVGLRTHHYLKTPGDSASGPGIGVHVMPPERFEKVMSSHGIGNDTLVVGYDSYGGLYAARLWWTLNYFGHTNVKVLNGGFRKWFEEGRPVSLDSVKIEKTDFKAAPPRANMIALKSDVLASIDRDDTVIWDVRSRDEHTGEDKRANKRGGHIPGARHLEWLDLTAKPTRSGRFLPADEMRAKLEAAGVTPDKRVITHCQAGIRAAQAYFSLALLGYDDIANYDGSWAEWGNDDDTPVVAGE